MTPERIPVHGVTVCPPRLRPFAERLALTFTGHNDGHFLVVVTDEGATGPEPGSGSERVRIATIDDLPLAARARLRGTPLHRWLPWAASAALDAHPGVTVALSPTTMVVRPLDRFAASAERGGLAVVPRILDVARTSGQPVNASAVLHAGVIEPGLIAFADGPATRRVLRWWKRAAASPGTERLADLLPALGAAVVRDPGLGVSRWNLDERVISDGAYGPMANDAPLRTCDLAGLDTRPDLVGPAWHADGDHAPVLEGPALLALVADHVATDRSRRCAS
jgi:hypothetical protein